MTCQNQTEKANQTLAAQGTVLPVLNLNSPASSVVQTEAQQGGHASYNLALQQKINLIQSLLPKIWGAGTATDGDWQPENPALNQCAVTALLVQDLVGGTLKRCPLTNGRGHYYNCLPNGLEKDLTVSQFEQIAAQPLRDQAIDRERAYVLSFVDTERRYQTLKQKWDSLFE